jgi:hypothetical protein
MSLQDIVPYRLPKTNGKRLIDPHIVIVGAGASIAACKYDKNGKQVPLLKNIHMVLGLTDVLRKYSFSNAEMQNFELLYSDIYGKPKFAKLQHRLEHEVCEYFKKLVIPDEPTYYDYLILSLTNKDAIISFNWDPFLMQAYRRNLVVGNLPELIFPHGNAGVGICHDCKIKGYADCLCPKCKNEFENMPLLFPVGQKSYNDGSIIQNEWSLAKQRLSNAAGITVYGYSAPVTDKEAVELMKAAYTESQIRDIAPFTIINLPDVETEQRKKWSEFFDAKMVLYCNSIEESLLWKNPRVSLETFFDAILQQHPRETEQPFSIFPNLHELQKFANSITTYDMYM